MNSNTRAGRAEEQHGRRIDTRYTIQKVDSPYICYLVLVK